MHKLTKWISLPDQASIWLAAWPQQSTWQMPTGLILDDKVEKKQHQTQAPSKPRLLYYEAEWTIMVGQDDKLRIEWIMTKWCCLSRLYSFDYSRKSDSCSWPRATHRECIPNTDRILFACKVGLNDFSLASCLVYTITIYILFSQT